MNRPDFRPAIILASLFISLGPLFAREIPLAPDSPDEILREAFRNEIEGNAQQAGELFQQYFDTGQESGFARAEYGRHLADTGAMEEALKQARRALELEPGDSENVILLARIQRKMGHPEKAVEILEPALSRFENDGSIEFFLAESLRETNRKEEAELHYRQVLFHLESAGSQAPAYRSLSLWRIANFHLEKNDPEGARPYLNRYYRHNPERIYPLFLLGYYVNFSMGNYDESREQLMRVYANREELEDPEDQFALLSALARIAYLEDLPEQGPLFREALEQNPGDIFLQGLRLQWLGENAFAMKYLIPLARKNPSDFILRTSIVRILEDEGGSPGRIGEEVIRLSELAAKQGLSRRGLELSKKALKLARMDPEKSLSLARIYRVMAYHYAASGEHARSALTLSFALEEGEKEGLWEASPEKKRELELERARHLAATGIEGSLQAVEICNRLIEDDPDNAYPYFILGLVRIDREDWKGARGPLDRAGELAPGNSGMLFYRALVHYHSGDEKGAIDILNKLIRREDVDARALNFLGYLYAEKGENLDRAREMVEKALRMEPGNASYEDSLGWIFFKSGHPDPALYHIRYSSFLMEESGNIDPTVYDHLGDVLSSLDRHEAALASFQKGVSLIEKRKRGGKEINREDAGLLESMKDKIRNHPAGKKKPGLDDPERTEKNSDSREK